MRSACCTSLLAIILSASPVLGQETVEPGRIIARAGAVSVTAGELTRRLELMPSFGHWGGKLDGKAKVDALYSLLGERLLAEEARSIGLDSSSTVMNSMADVRGMILRDELYRVEVASKVTVTSRETARELQKALRLRVCVFVFCPREEDARFLRSIADSAGGLLSMSIDTSIQCLRDTVTVAWGEAQPEIERAVFGTPPGRLAEVVQSGEGYYLIGVLRELANPEFAGLTSPARQEKVAATLRERKERERLDTYTKGLFGGGAGALHTAPFRHVVLAIDRLFERERDSAVVLPVDLARQLKGADPSFPESDTLLSTADRAWSVGQVCERLVKEGFVWAPRRSGVNARRLNDRLRLMAWQETLVEEAARRHLDERPEVRSRLEQWDRASLVAALEQRLRRALPVTDPEVWGELRRTGAAANLPEVRIREIWTRDTTDIRKAREALVAGSEWNEVARRYSSRPSARSGGVTEYFSIDQRDPVGEIAWRSDTGRLMGPIRADGGWLLMEVVGKRGPERVPDSLAAAFDAARSSLIERKLKRRETDLLAAIGRRDGIWVDQATTVNLPVSNLPMVSFRILGFGGRMFEVPFLERRTQWVDEMERTGGVLP